MWTRMATEPGTITMVESLDSFFGIVFFQSFGITIYVQYFN